MQTSQDIKEKIDGQKKHYKGAKNSLCRDCRRVEEDCFDHMKYVVKATDSTFSAIEKCTGFKPTAIKPK